LIGMDKLEITEQARAIGTFEISIEPDADCCTLFVPRHPDTRVGRDVVEALEHRLDVAALVQSGLEQAREEQFVFPPERQAARSEPEARNADAIPPGDPAGASPSPRRP
jgi:Thiamine biosynthesis protein (ThiI)